MTLQQLSEDQAIRAWHFLASDGHLANTTPPVVVVAGETYSVTGALALCEHGLHGCVRGVDALAYAPGPIVCRTMHWGEVRSDGFKLCSTYRRVLWLADASTTLHEFACETAERLLLAERAAGREPDPRSWAAVAAKRAWLRGELDDTALDAARSAARSAAWDAGGDAAWDRVNQDLEKRLYLLAPASVGGQR